MSQDDFNHNSILVKDIMNKALISVNPVISALQIAKMMAQGGVGAIIVKENKIPVGIITDRDFAVKIAAHSLPLDTPVEKIMSSPVITINHNDSISHAAKVMNNKKIRKLAVMDNGKITGIITSTNLVDQLAKESINFSRVNNDKLRKISS
ncbi:MAG: CBS domain-containing protein [Candidatus Nitrosopumilus sp. bin_32a]